MKRRTFLFQTSGVILTACVAPPRIFAASDPLDRIGMGTVLFRSRFRQTRTASRPDEARELTLLDVPQFYRDRFGLRQVEFWSYHFESLERGYLEKLKERLTAAHATLINVQVDTPYNLAAADENVRRRSIGHVCEWIDAAAFLGSGAIRINPGNGAVHTSIASLREVNAHAKSRGLPLLTENHFGIEMDPDVHLRIREEAGPENVYTLPDFGNYPESVRFEALAKIMPYAYLVSAKAAEFNDKLEHLSYDFDACVRLAESHGFKGIYSVEQWNREDQHLDFERVGDWLIERVRANLQAFAF